MFGTQIIYSKYTFRFLPLRNRIIPLDTIDTSNYVQNNILEVSIELTLGLVL
jgi:hypothetical protein